MKAIVISIDAMIGSDLAVLKKMDALQGLFKKCSQSNEVLPVFPSLTYPCHVSMLTGCWPERHGIVTNDVFSPGVKHAPWYWLESSHKVPTLFRWAKRAGLKTALVAWPSCGGCSDVDVLVSKVYAQLPDEECNSPLAKDIYDRHKGLLEGFQYEKLDDFAELCTIDIIKEHSPDLLYTYFLEVDSSRHARGVDTDLHIDVLQRIGQRIARIYEAVKEKGEEDQTTFFICSDHGQIDTECTFNINQALLDLGYITLDEEGRIASWRIYAQSAAFTSLVYSQNISHTEVRNVLERIGKENPGSVERILNRFECREFYHLDGDFTYALEGREGVAFSSQINVPLVMKPGMYDYRTARATHGHSPERGAKPVFLVCGAAAKDAAILEEARLIDEPVTVLKSFGIEMDGVDGRALVELLKEKN